MAGLGKKTFTAGEVLTAADVNGYLMEQSVMVFGGTAARSSAVPTPSEGMVTYLSDLNDIQAYDGSNWISTGLTAGTTTANYGWPIPASGSIASLGTAIDTTVAGLGSGLTLVKSQTIGSAVSSVTVSNAFSATYDVYLITASGGSCSVSENDMGLKIGSATTGYYAGRVKCLYSSAAVTGDTDNNGSSFLNGGGRTSSYGIQMHTIVKYPYLSTRTVIINTYAGLTSGDYGFFASGFLNNSNSYTDFTLTPANGTLTGGTIYVYGYQK